MLTAASDALLTVPSLEWWQALVALAAAVGLSPAPWLFGMARDKIAFTAPMRAAFETRVEEIKAAHARELAERDRHHAAELQSRADVATEVKESRELMRIAHSEEQDRADRATAALAETAAKTANLTGYLLEAFNEAKGDAP